MGIPDLGLVAAHEAGIDLSQLALIPNPGADLVAVTAALLDGLDLVAVAGTQRLRGGDRQRLTARARQRGAVLVATDDWPGADVELGLTHGGGGWDGLSQDGMGDCVLAMSRFELRDVALPIATARPHSYSLAPLAQPPHWIGRKRLQPQTTPTYLFRVNGKRDDGARDRESRPFAGFAVRAH